MEEFRPEIQGDMMQEPRMKGICFMVRKPNGEVDRFWDVLCWRVLVNNLEHSREIWSCTGRSLISSCRSSMEIILNRPVAM